MRKMWLIVVLLLPALLVPAWGAGLIIVDEPGEVRINPPDRPIPPWPMPRPIHRFTPLEIRLVRADVSIEDQVARTKLEQVFYNPNSRELEGTFLLPLPKGAHIESFRLEVNGKMTDAEMLGADKARDIYEEIVRKAKDPALLEYVGRDLLKVRIFPIEPHSTKKIELSYTQLLESDSGLVEYALPVNMARHCPTPVEELQFELELKSSTPLKSVYSPSHDLDFKRHGEKRVTAALERKGERLERDVQIFFSAEEREMGVDFLSYTEGGEGWFMMLVSPGVREKGKVLPKDVVFVVDTSGSMAGKKIEQARKALAMCIENLNENDRFEIIRFSTDVEPLFGELRSASEANREKGLEFAGEFRALGGTAINDALLRAVRTNPGDDSEKGRSGRPHMIIFLTDGLPTTGERSEGAILQNVKKEREDGTRLFTFGVGTDVNTHLLDRLAEGTEAVSQYVLPDEDLEVKVSSFFSKVSDPVLTDVEIDFGELRVSKLHPGRLPDLFSGQQLVVLGRYDGKGKTTATLRGKVGDEAKEFRYDIQFPEESDEHDFIPRLWATRRVGYLLDEVRLNGGGDADDNGELEEEITRLAKKYGIVTPYTSYLVQEDKAELVRGRATPRRANGIDLGREQPIGPGAVAASPPQPAREPFQRILRESVSGDAAVAGARYSSSLKQAASEQEIQLAPGEVFQFFDTGRLEANARGNNTRGPLTKSAGKQMFAFDGGAWVQTELLQAENARADAVAVKFGSDDYWALAAKPELQEILALGTNLFFQYDGKVYHIVE